MKKLLAILAGISMVAAGTSPIEAYTSSAISNSDVRIKDKDADPTEMKTTIIDGTKMDVSFKQNILLRNNKEMPEVSYPDMKRLENAKGSYDDIYGFGVRITADVHYARSNVTNPAHDWTPLWKDGIGNNMGEPDNTYGLLLKNLNIRDIKIQPADANESQKIGHTELGDQDANNVEVKVAVSFEIDLPDLPFMVKVNVCDWHIQRYSAPGTKGGTRGYQEWDENGGRAFNMWLPSKLVDKKQDAKNSKVPGIVKVR